MEAVALTTTDGVRLAGAWHPVVDPHGFALLLHMMPATKESYDALAGALAARDVASLAFDQRGHGESAGGPRGYEAFTDAEQQAKRHDVAAALAWLAARGMTEERLVLVGASIGANLALETLAAHPAVPAAVLLSPGHIYRGIETEPLARRVRVSQAVLLAAGGDDDAYATQTVVQLASILGERATVHTFASAGHGTMLLERVPGFLDAVVDWMVVRVTHS